MKARLSPGLHQHLILTPQLRQAIRLLQLSAIELEAEIAEAVASNPLLDWAEAGEAGPADAHEVRDADGAQDASTHEREPADERIDEHWDRESEPWQERIGPASDGGEDFAGGRQGQLLAHGPHSCASSHWIHFSGNRRSQRPSDLPGSTRSTRATDR